MMDEANIISASEAKQLMEARLQYLSHSNVDPYVIVSDKIRLAIMDGFSNCIVSLAPSSRKIISDMLIAKGYSIYISSNPKDHRLTISWGARVTFDVKI